MIELHLIGYTSDLRHLVFDVDEEGGRARYRVPVDADLLLTLDEMRSRRREAGFHDPAAPPAGHAASRDEPEDAVDEVAGAEPGPVLGGTSRPPEPAVAQAPAEDPGSEGPDGASADASRSTPAGDREAVEVDADPGPAGDLEEVGSDPDVEPEGDAPGAEVGPDAGGSGDDGRVESLLSPAEIQSLLRRGVSPRTVAERAGTEIRWIERWLPPILAERRQVLEEAHAICLERARLGVSKQPLARAVRTNLRAKRVDLDDVEWTTKRRADGSWTVSVRYRSRGRRRTASWRLDREKGRLSPASELARELGFARSRRRGR